MADTIPGNLIITIDGPSGAGKSTVAKLLARKLGYTYLDTGAMYRGVAYAFARRLKSQGADEQAAYAEETVEKASPEEIEQFLKGVSLRFEFAEETKVYLDGEDISREIREPVISMLASRLSQNGAVREYLYSMQRSQGKAGGIIVEGRDTGSVVFPNAGMKFYLDANADERAKRRHLELSSKGATVDMVSVREDMKKRDTNDAQRDLAPLVVPEGACYVDTSGLDADGVVKVLYSHITGSGG